MDYRQLVIDSGKRMYDSGLTVGAWGNISIRDFDTGYVYITPSGMDYYICQPEDINIYDVDGNLIEGFRKPSIEKPLHLSLHKARPDIGAVMHTHPLYSSVFGILQEPIPAVTEEFAQVIGREVRLAEYFLPGTVELGDAVAKAVGDGAAALLVSHGAVSVGKDIDECFLVSEAMEKAAQLYYMTRCIGTPKIISDADVQAMYNFRRNGYGQ